MQTEKLVASIVELSFPLQTLVVSEEHGKRLKGELNEALKRASLTKVIRSKAKITGKLDAKKGQKFTFKVGTSHFECRHPGIALQCLYWSTEMENLMETVGDINSFVAPVEIGKWILSLKPLTEEEKKAEAEEKAKAEEIGKALQKKADEKKASQTPALQKA